MLKKSSRREIGIGVVCGTALSIALSVVLLATTSLTSQVGFMITLTGVVLSALLGACVAFANRLDQLDALVLEGTRLRTLSEMPDVREKVARLIVDLEAIEAKGGRRAGFFWEAALVALDEASRSVSGIANGVASCISEHEIQYIDRALRHTKKNVTAIAARGHEWWEDPEADVYWTTYEMAARRLSIRRVFLIDGGLSEQITKVLDRHVASGMETFWTPIDQVPARLRRPVVIFDDKLLHRLTTDPHLDAGYVSFTDSARELEEAKAQFTAIMSLPATRQWPAADRMLQDRRAGR